jgi:hypothetical protein
MAKILCWEEKDNGGYCKNYPLKNKNKCHVHHEYQENIMVQVLVLGMVLSIIIISYTSYTSYNYNTSDIEIMLKEYLLQLYKIDKNMINVYIKNLNVIVSYYYSIIYMHITRHT